MKIINRIKNRIKYEKDKASIKKLLVEMYDYLSARGVRLIYVEPPIATKIKGLTQFEMDRIKNWSFNQNKYKEEIEKMRMIFSPDITPEYVLSVFDGGIVVQGEKRKILLDFKSENQHIINGRRVTTNNPSIYHNTIYTHGACTWRGVGCNDSQTIASYLQTYINNNFPNSYRLVNSAIGRGSDIYDDFQFIKEQQYKSGDIVIVGSHGIINTIKPSFFTKNGIEYLSTSPLFHRPHNIGEWFTDDTLHTIYRGNNVIAQAIYNKLSMLGWLSKSKYTDDMHRKQLKMHDSSFLIKGEKIYGDNKELLGFIESLKPYRRGDKTSRNGAIVMNCNPFTLGHRYLIEYASSQVDNLYIFVVEENRSYFSFEDRFKLVCSGTADLKNVIVLPSGNFIISATTFPGYFYKDNIKDVKIDCSNDLSVFAQYIAPALGIKVRFAGDEPIDPITRQYNDGMREILPQYGIDFCVIPRKHDEKGIGVISASRVRKYYEIGELDEIKKIVPYTTYDYLLKRYNREKSDSNK